jgi:hypothetical protein
MKLVDGEKNVTFARQPGLIHEARGFPSPPHDGFGFQNFQFLIIVSFQLENLGMHRSLIVPISGNKPWMAYEPI